MNTSFTVHLKRLVLEKAARTGERITMVDVEKATGLAPLTIRRWYTGKVKRIESDTVGKLAAYLNVGMSDLVSIEEVSS
jgi:DNA-binding Xre family transcriptional regulator